MKINLHLDESLWDIAKTVDEKAKPIERYVSLVLTETIKEAALGLNPQFTRNELTKLNNKTRKILSSYDDWIAIDILNDKEGVSIETNFNLIFKTRKGTLYGHKKGVLRRIFYTAHCLERFKRRVEKYQYKHITRSFYKNKRRNPIVHEVMDKLILERIPCLEFGLTNTTEVLLNIGVGVLVLDSKLDCYVAKTFINHNYAKRNASWYKVYKNNWEIKGYDPIDNWDLKELLHSSAFSCTPHFI